MVDGAVDHVARLVDAVIGIGFPQDVTFKIDLDQARSGDFLVEQAIQVDQQVFVIAGDTRGDVVVNQVGHAVDVGQPVTGCEVEPCFPFFGADFVFDAAELRRIVGGHGLVQYRAVVMRRSAKNYAINRVII